MKPTDFSTHVSGFLAHHLAAQRNLSLMETRSEGATNLIQTEASKP